MEYLSNVEEMTKEYLIKPAKSSRTPNNSEPSTTSNLAKPTSNTEPSTSSNLAKLACNNEPSTSRKTDDSIQHSPDDWSEDFDDTERKGRLEWGIYRSRKLLTIYKKNSEQLQTSRNKKKVWDGIAASLREETGGNLTITGEQARERFYTLKRGYRKYIEDSNKTGNKRPRPFPLENEMADILNKDPTFNPIGVRGSLNTSHTGNSDEEGEDDSNPPPPEKKKKKSKTEELQAILAERDEKFLSVLREMQEAQNTILNKLIDKLSQFSSRYIYILYMY